MRNLRTSLLAAGVGLLIAAVPLTACDNHPAPAEHEAPAEEQGDDGLVGLVLDPNTGGVGFPDGTGSGFPL